jgi:hypothetical protein
VRTASIRDIDSTSASRSFVRGSLIADRMIPMQWTQHLYVRLLLTREQRIAALPLQHSGAKNDGCWF